jgi:membrane protein required for colicin V production
LGLNTLDIILLIIILVPTVFGFRKGLLKSLFSLAGIIIGLFLASKFHSGVALVLVKVIGYEKASNVIAFILIFFLIYFISLFIAGKLADISFITKWIDKAAGLAFGALKGILLASVLVLIIISFKLISPSTTSNSILVKYVAPAAPKTYEFITMNLMGSKKSFLDVNSFIQIDSVFKKVK